jgi:tetratricopeptide (TPR) repeat protein
MSAKVQKLIQESAKLWNNNEPDKAVKVCEKILDIEPNNAWGLINLAASYGAQEGITDRVRQLFDKAYKFSPTNIAVLTNMAAIALEDGDYDKCLEYHELILNQQPLHSSILSSKGRILLTLGRLKEGFELNEHGLGIESCRGALHPTSKAAWRGRYCNKLLITYEQGLGDTIHFIRYAQFCKFHANKVYLLCPPEISGLMKSCPWLDGVVQTICENEFDEHISVMSLPHIFGTTLENIPAAIPYLYARKSKVEANLIKNDKLKVGLVWAGNPRRHSIKASMVDKKRSITFDHYKPLLELSDEITFYNLQYGEVVEGIENPIKNAKDYEDTAAVIAQLDLVVTVDTSVAHVTGAMGIPVWILSRYSGCWRWLTERSDSPWYPTARLFRQPRPDDWTSVISEVHESLKKLIETRKV